LLAELDTADLVEQRVQQDINVQNAEASYVKAKQSYEIQKSQNQTDIARAERELEFARLDLTKYVEGDWPQELQRSREEILLADEELTRARQDLEWSRKLAERGFLEASQLQADELAEKRAEIQMKQRERALELLEQYEFPRRRRELEADAFEKERELERVKLQADARIVDFEADMRTSKARLDLQTEKLAKIDRQIEKGRIVAPVAGMVVYAQERNRWGGEVMQEGAGVRERQEILTIPQSQGMIVEASLHESVLQRVDVGMPCAITVGALGDRAFRGRVKFKAVLPDQNSWWANPDLRVYRTEIELLDEDPFLRPGMSCSIEILVDELDDVLFVPLQSIYLDGGETVCFVKDAGKVEVRGVEVGQSNEAWVEVHSGVAEGEVVLLSQPAGFELSPASGPATAPEEPDGPEGGRPGPGGSRGERRSNERGGERGGQRGNVAGERPSGGKGSSGAGAPSR